MNIFFDMDGTIADLYSVNNWLELLRCYNAKPYQEAKPLINLSRLARQLNNLKKNGNRIFIISWTSKVSNPTFDEEIKISKIEWLKNHLKSVEWDKIIIVPYGTPKQEYKLNSEDILFDDEEKNLTEWGINAFPPSRINDILFDLIKN